MANTLLTNEIIARMGMVELDNALVFAKQVYREYKREFKMVGDTVSIRRPIEFTAGTGAVATAQDIVDANTSITVDQQRHVMIRYTANDLTLKEEAFAERIVRPAMRTLANQIDLSVAGLYKRVWNWVGTPANTIDSFADLARGPERLDLCGVATDDRIAVLAPTDTWAMAGSAAALFLERIGAEAYRKGELGNIAGLNMFSTQNVQTHTVGALGGTPLVNGASQNVTYAASKDAYTQTLNIDGASNSITGWAAEGDVFTIANVFAVNPVTKATQGYLQQFVVRAAADSNGSGQVALTISPPIITTGPYQTVSAVPADNAAVTWVGTAATGYRQNIVMHKNAFALVMVDIDIGGTETHGTTERWNGFSATVTRQFDIDNFVNKMRFDVLYGVQAVNPRLATRVNG